MVKYSFSEPHRAYLMENEVPRYHWIDDDDKIIDLLNELDIKLLHTNEKIFEIIDNKISILEHDLEKSVKAGMPTSSLYSEIDLLEELKEELKEVLNE